MAFGSQNGSSQKTPVALAEINVTPLVDVMLVLLIVFMVSAPLMQQGLQIDIPKANTGAMESKNDPVTVSVKSDKTLYLNGQALASGSLETKLRAISQAKPDVRVYVQADQSLSYGYLARVIAQIKQAGIQRVGLVTEPGQSENL